MRGGEKDGSGSSDSNSGSFGASGIHEIGINSLCGVDGREPLPATIRKGHATAYQMVCQEVCTGFI